MNFDILRGQFVQMFFDFLATMEVSTAARLERMGEIDTADLGNEAIAIIP